MTSVQLQFHAIPEEVMEVMVTWAKEFQLHGAVETFDRQVALWSPASLQAAAESLGEPWSIYLNDEPFNADALVSQEIYKAHPGCLIATMAKVRDATLRESAMGAITDDACKLKLWRRLIRRFRSNMNKGAWIVNPITGHRRRLEGHRFTDGARKAQESGVKMLGSAGLTEYVLD